MSLSLLHNISPLLALSVQDTIINRVLPFFRKYSKERLDKTKDELAQELKHSGQGVHTALLSQAGIRLGIEELTEILLHLPTIDKHVQELRDQLDHSRSLKKKRVAELDNYLDTQDDENPLKKYRHDLCNVLSMD